MASDKIEIVDFRARSDRIVYIVADGDMGYVVVNNDTGISESGIITRRKTEREIIAARLTCKEWRRLIEKGSGVNFKGFEYAHCRLHTVKGHICPNDISSYSASTDMLYVKPWSVAKLFTPPLIEGLEHFLVPHDVAEKIRAYTVNVG